MLFLGHHEHSIDAKQRLAIPAEFRARWRPEVHGGAWIASPATLKIIRLYPETDYTNLTKSGIRSLTLDEDESELQASLHGLSARVEMDSAGRIRLPADMLETTELGTDVVVVGCGNYLEIRDRKEWIESKKARLRDRNELIKRTRQARDAEPPSAIRNPPRG